MSKVETDKGQKGMMKGAVILSIAAFIIVSLSVFAGASIFLCSILKS